MAVICASRSQFKPVTCLPSTFAPATKSAKAAAERSTNTGIVKPCGPIEPTLQPTAANTSASLAKVSG